MFNLRNDKVIIPVRSFSIAIICNNVIARMNSKINCIRHSCEYNTRAVGIFDKNLCLVTSQQANFSDSNFFNRCDTQLQMQSR